MWCNLSQRAEICDHPSCQDISKGSSHPNFGINEQEEEQIARMLMYQNSLLTQVATNSNHINNCLDRIIEKSNNISSVAPLDTVVPIINEIPQPDGVFHLLASGKDFQYSLQLESLLTPNIYKERGFELVVSVRDKNGQQMTMLENHRFKVMVFTMDNPPKPLKLNISGKKILRGTTESNMRLDGLINFSNIVINEVTSHYVNDSFYLTVACVNSTEIKPLAVSNICVKARKPSKA